jgi:glycosyltransferase involved in cell wall biosynthesis
MLYVGNMDAKRGLDVFVQSIPILKQTDPHVLAVIVGSGMMEQRLRQLARELRVEDNVLLTGWMDQREVPGVIARADVCIIPHFVTEHTDTTIPNKIYDYMAQGKPVVVTQCSTLKEIVEQYECGRVYEDRNPAALADAVRSLVDGGIREILGARGRRAVEQHFRWDKDAGVLLQSLQTILGGAFVPGRPLPQV